MDIIKGLLDNDVLIACIISWFLAQAIKTLLNYIMTKELKPERMIGAGGMPSAHSSSVCALAFSVGKNVGVSSTQFAICFLFAMVVMYDATGVRRSAGKNAKVINELVSKNKDMKDTQKLKESLGHTPLEVLAGAVLGIIVALIV